MSRPSRKQFYEELFRKYPVETPIGKIASDAGLSFRTVQNAMYDYKLRPSRNRRGVYPANCKVLDKLFALGTDKQIARDVVTKDTVGKWRRRAHGPSIVLFAAVAEANGLVLDVVETKILDGLLTKINDLRGRDMTGPEACAVMSDMVHDIIEGEAAC